MMGKRNAYAYLARQRKAGPHSQPRRPDEYNEGSSEECPECFGSGIDFEGDVVEHSGRSCETCEGTGVVYD